MLDRELKKGSAELIILSIIEARARHGCEISKLIERQRRIASATSGWVIAATIRRRPPLRSQKKMSMAKTFFKSSADGRR